MVAEMTPSDKPARALIFDMDGTVVDNMRYHEAAWGRLLTEHGLPFDADSFFKKTAGMASAEILVPLFPDADAARIDALGHDKEIYYREDYAPHVAPLAGLLALMARADAAKVPMALATAAPPGNVDLVLDKLKLRERFVTVVSPSQGFPGKPNPDLFLEAARRMGVPAADCLVFEDAPNGVEAARRAGMRAVALLTMLDAQAFAAYDNLIASARDFTALDGLPALRFA
jgi:HAD superfamily hydrolase (TIGR01509 family)